MKKLMLVLAASLVSATAFAAAPDCSKFNLQLSYNQVEPIKDIAAGKVTGSVRMYADRCEAAGQILEVTYSKDPVDPATGKRKAQVRVKVSKVTTNLAWAALNDAMAKAQGYANANALRAALLEIYGKDSSGQPRKDEKGNVIDPTKQVWTNIEFAVVK